MLFSRTVKLLPFIISLELIFAKTDDGYTVIDQNLNERYFGGSAGVHDGPKVEKQWIRTSISTEA